MSTVSIGSVLEVDRVPVKGQNPFTVEHIGREVEGPYYQGTWANGRLGVVYPEDLA